jgi:hypothetical protein
MMDFATTSISIPGIPAEIISLTKEGQKNKNAHPKAGSRPTTFEGGVVGAEKGGGGAGTVSFCDRVDVGVDTRGNEHFSIIT